MLSTKEQIPIENIGYPMIQSKKGAKKGANKEPKKESDGKSFILKNQIKGVK